MTTASTTSKHDLALSTEQTAPDVSARCLPLSLGKRPSFQVQATERMAQKTKMHNEWAVVPRPLFLGNLISVPMPAGTPCSTAVALPGPRISLTLTVNSPARPAGSFRGSACCLGSTGFVLSSPVGDSPRWLYSGRNTLQP